MKEFLFLHHDNLLKDALSSLGCSALQVRGKSEL